MADPQPDRSGGTSTPVALKVFGLALLIAVVIAIVMLPGALGMGGHGPQLHQQP